MSIYKYKQKLFEDMNGCCAYCGNELEYKKATIDHKTPKGLGGTDDYDNLFISCWSCNHYKGRRDIEMFRTSIKNIYKRLENSSFFRLGLKYEIFSFNNIDNIKFYFENINSVYNSTEYTKAIDILETAINNLLSNNMNIDIVDKIRSKLYQAIDIYFRDIFFLDKDISSYCNVELENNLLLLWNKKDNLILGDIELYKENNKLIYKVVLYTDDNERQIIKYYYSYVDLFNFLRRILLKNVEYK